MKRILLLFLPFLPYLATAQVAKDTVTVLTLAQIPAGAIRDTTNLTFVQDNAFKKATFDSLYKYTRVKLLAADSITSAELANALSNETGTGAAVFATSPVLTTPNLGTPSAATLTNATGLPIGTGLTGLGAENRIPYATSATALTTSTGLTFDGTNFATTGTATATKFIPTGNVATGNGMYLPAANTLGFSTNGTKQLEIASTGAATFSSSVTTSGGGFVANMGSTNTEGLMIQRANTSSNAIIKFRNNATDTWILGNRNTGDETFRLYNYNVSSDVLTVTNSGNVGIGTESPSEKLHVDGNARITAMNGINDIGASATGVLQAATSDYNLKNSIEDSNFGLNHILQLRPVTFLYNDQDRKIHSEIPEVGFIAQDVNDVIPNAVSPTGEGTLQLDYRAITATLTKAIQEQQQQIEQLKQRITQLENK